MSEELDGGLEALIRQSLESLDEDGMPFAEEINGIYVQRSVMTEGELLFCARRWADRANAERANAEKLSTIEAPDATS